jgi:small GTP-binding protein
MQPTPRSLRLHIGIFGRRNVGKSSLLNAITRQAVSIVSEIAGTTTDPVEKPMELLPLGPVQFVDTAGVDDEGALGELRIERTKAVLDRVDLGVVVTEGGGWGAFEDALVSELESRLVPVLVVFNKSDLRMPDTKELARLQVARIPAVAVSSLTGAGVVDVREALLSLAPADFFDRHASDQCQSCCGAAHRRGGQ